MDRRDHWEGVYRSRPRDELSWFQARAEMSQELITGAAPDLQAPILDVGGGASPLSAALADAGYRRVTVVDLALAPLVGDPGRSRPRSVRRVVGDVLEAPFAAGTFAVWHDRAVFHFLTAPADRARYVAQVRRILRPDGFVVVATFAADGPTRCSGLPVARYAPEELHAAFGDGFAPLTARRELHRTPSGTTQAFTWMVLRYGVARGEGP